MSNSKPPSNDSAAAKLRRANREALKGNLELAERLCTELLNTDDVIKARAYFLLGQIKQQSKQVQLALNCFLSSLKLKEDAPDTLFQVGWCYQQTGDLPTAIHFFERSLELKPEFAEALNNLGICFRAVGKYRKAREAFEKAIRLAPASPNILVSYAVFLHDTGETEKARDIQEKIAKKHPKDPFVINNLGAIYMSLGRRDEAERLFRKVLKVDPMFGLSHYGLSRCKKWTEKDLEEIARTERLLDRSMGLKTRINIHFALGKMYDDCQDHDKAFQHLKKGNSLVHIANDIYDVRFFEKLTKPFTRNFFQRQAEYGASSELPIFIVGAPRSGSTLIEQMLASHAGVAGLGETGNVDKLHQEIVDESPDRKLFPDFLLEDPSRQALDGYAKRYMEMNRELDDRAKYFVDKSLFNYRMLGFIMLMFPNAKIVHSTRNPIDTCLSCYFQNFSYTLEWAYDLESLGAYYRAYRRFMDWWEKELPHPIFEVNYEELIADPETQSKRLFEFCGLDWTPACLDFHKTRRSVVTASNWQVRQPLYRTSLARWLPYAPHLGPLVDALGDLLDEKTIDELKGIGIKPKRRPLLSRVFHRP